MQSRTRAERRARVAQAPGRQAQFVEQNAFASEKLRTSAESIRETIKPVASSEQAQSQAAAEVAEAAAHMSDQLTALELNVNELPGHSETLSNHIVKFFADDQPAADVPAADAAFPISVA